MADICSDVSELKEQIKDMLSKSYEKVTYEATLPDGSKVTRSSRFNQTAALDGFKITDIKPSIGAYHRTPKGKAVIYTTIMAEPSLEPDSRDVTEIIEYDRPFMCRAITAFGKPQIGCYTPGNSVYEFVKDDMEQTEEATSDLRSIIEKRWGTYKPQTDAERAFAKELRTRRHNLTDILDDLAGDILKTCKRSL